MPFVDSSSVMLARTMSLLLLGSTVLAHAAIPNLSVTRTGTLFFAASDLTTNGVPGLTNFPGAVVSDLPSMTARGGHLQLLATHAWVRRYVGQGASQDSVLDMSVMPDGRVTVCGSSFGQTYGVATIRYTSDGTALWTNRYDSASQDYASFVSVDATSNAWIVGYTDSNDASEGTVIIKYADNGAPLLTNYFPQLGSKFARVDRGGNLVLALTALGGNTNLDLIVKLDPLGIPLWTNRYRPGPSLFDHLNALALDGSDAVIATGTDYGTVKYSPAGLALWTNQISLPQSGVPADLAVDAGGNPIVTGDVWDFSVNPVARTYTTTKFATNGVPLWTNRLAPAMYQGGGVPLVLVEPSGDVVIIGGTSNSSTHRLSFALTKLSSNGDLIWTNLFEETNASGLNSKIAATVDSAGGIFLMTSCSGATGTKLQFLTVKFDARGQPVWTNRFDGESAQDAIAQSIGLDAAGNAYISGTVGGLSGGGDFATISYREFLRYTPPPNFVGVDSFTFAATDAAGNRATNTVNITVTAESLWFNPLHSDLRGAPRRLHLDGASGNEPVVLHAASVLGAWSPIATNSPVNGTVEFLVPSGGPQQFYRAVQNPAP